MELEVVEPAKPAVKFEADPLISFIVPVHAGHLDKSVFKRCLMSLDDQDYENFRGRDRLERRRGQGHRRHGGVLRQQRQAGSG
jgi:hypothetical protein